MATRIWISEIKFSDDTTLQLEKDDIVVFVGPNNAGKSSSLKESATLLRAKTNKGKVLKDITIEKEGDETEFFSYLQSYSTKHFGGNQHPHYQGFGYKIYEPNAKSWWTNYKNGLSDLYSLFVNILSTEQRIQAANSAPNIKLTTEAIQHPIHFLQKDDFLEKRFSDYFRQAFGTDRFMSIQMSSFFEKNIHFSSGFSTTSRFVSHTLAGLDPQRSGCISRAS